MTQGIPATDCPLTQARLQELLHYDPETGIFTWRTTEHTGKNKAFVLHSKGDIAGSIIGHKYLRVTVEGVRYYCHRLAWFYMTAKWPHPEVDHENGNGADNRWTNLREATRRKNAQNLRSARADSASGILGVSWDDSRSQWVARIKVGGAYKFLGRFDSAEAAEQAYRKKKRAEHDGCTI